MSLAMLDVCNKLGIKDFIVTSLELRINMSVVLVYSPMFTRCSV